MRCCTQAIKSWNAEAKDKCGKAPFRTRADDERDFPAKCIHDLVDHIHWFCFHLNGRLPAAHTAVKVTPTYEQLETGIAFKSVLDRANYHLFRTTADSELEAGMHGCHRGGNRMYHTMLPKTAKHLVVDMVRACENGQHLVLTAPPDAVKPRTSAAMALAFSMCISQALPLAIVSLPGAVDDMVALVKRTIMPMPEWLLRLQGLRKRSKTSLEATAAYSILTKSSVHETRNSLNQRMYDLGAIWGAANAMIGTHDDAVATRVMCAFYTTWMQITKSENMRNGHTRPQEPNGMDEPLDPVVAQSKGLNDTPCFISRHINVHVAPGVGRSNTGQQDTARAAYQDSFPMHRLLVDHNGASRLINSSSFGVVTRCEKLCLWGTHITHERPGPHREITHTSQLLPTFLARVLWYRGPS